MTTTRPQRYDQCDDTCTVDCGHCKGKGRPTTKSYWLSWWQTRALGSFELYSPWWVSGSRHDGAQSICAAVRAGSEEDARRIVIDSFDKSPDMVEFRFVEEMKPGASPFTDRFPRADWMRWDDRPAKETAR